MSSINNVSDVQFTEKLMDLISEKSGKLGKYTFLCIGKCDINNLNPRQVKFMLKSELIVGCIFQTVKMILLKFTF